MGSRVLRSGVAAVVIAWGYPGSCQAGPTAVDDPAVQADAVRGAAAQAAAMASPGPSTPLVGATRGGVPADRHPTFSPGSDDKLLAQERADALASARDPALIPMDMQGVGAQAHPTPSALPKKLAPDSDSDGNGLKNLAVAARDWMHDVFPSLSGKGPDNLQDGVPGGAISSGAGGDLGLPVEMQASGVSAMATRAGRPVEVTTGPQVHKSTAAAAPAETPGARLLAESAAEYSIQHALAKIRAALVHPLTWLLIVLVGATRIVVSRRRG